MCVYAGQGLPLRVGSRARRRADARTPHTHTLARHSSARRCAAGTSEERLDVDSGATTDDLRRLLADRFPGLADLLPGCALARNGGARTHSLQLMPRAGRASLCCAATHGPAPRPSRLRHRHRADGRGRRARGAASGERRVTRETRVRFTFSAALGLGCLVHAPRSYPSLPNATTVYKTACLCSLSARVERHEGRCESGREPTTATREINRNPRS